MGSSLREFPGRRVRSCGGLLTGGRFPKAMERTLKKNKLVKEHYERVKGLENIKAYLQSGRRAEFGDGLFRYYEELDL